MKIKHLVAILMIVLLVGCAKKAEPVPIEPEPVVVEPEPEPVEPVLTPEETEVKEQQEAAEAENVDVLITLDGFEPGELTMKVGDTVKWKNKVETIKGSPKRITLADRNHIIPARIALNYDGVYEYTFTQPGEYKIYELSFIIKDEMIIVVE